MIKRFRHKGLQALFEAGSTRGLNAGQVDRLRNIMLLLNKGPLPDALRIPAYRLHQLKGDLKGHWSVRVTGNWRLIFLIEDGDAIDVDLIDYH